MQKQSVENTKKVFDSVADNFSELSDPLWPFFKEYFNSKLFVGGSIKKVLDVAGGGIRPEEIFCDETAKQLDLFVGNDINFKMLARNKFDYRVNSDGYALPFKKETFDTILVIGCIHHFGQIKYEDRIDKAKVFFRGVQELLTKDGYIYIMEPSLLPFFEKLEKYLLFPLYKFFFRKKVVPIYIYAEKELKQIFDDLFKCEFFEYKTTAQVIGSKRKLYPPFFFLKWFKIPMGLLPYKYLFYRARLKND